MQEDATLGTRREEGRPRAAIHTLGCRLNLAESDLIRRQLEGAGYEVVSWEEPADLRIVNTCTVTRQADAKSRQALRGARRANPSARVAATGCFAQMHGPELARTGMADLVVGNGAKPQLIEHLQTSGDGRPVTPRIGPEPFVLPGFDAGAILTSDSGTRAHLKVQDGCDFVCAFCIIPKARGRSRPRDPGNLLEEARVLAGAGVRELVLTGVNVGTYDCGGMGLTDVVDSLAAIEGLARLRIGSIEPTTVDEGLLERMADPAHPLTPFLHLPLQSGSDAVLTAMRRRHGAEEYRAFAERALASVPGLCLGTDVMTGFPGEDDAAFGETVALLESLPFAYFHVFPFSEREGTAAFRMAGQVAPERRRRRAAVLRALGDEKRAGFHRRHAGETLEVLFEQPKSPGLAQGYTANYIRVEAAVSDAASLRNRLLPVRLVEGGAHRMAGMLAV